MNKRTAICWVAVILLAGAPLTSALPQSVTMGASTTQTGTVLQVLGHSVGNQYSDYASGTNRPYTKQTLRTVVNSYSAPTQTAPVTVPTNAPETQNFIQLAQPEPTMGESYASPAFSAPDLGDSEVSDDGGE